MNEIEEREREPSLTASAGTHTTEVRLASGRVVAVPHGPSFAQMVYSAA